jgi:hypothetical protein
MSAPTYVKNYNITDLAHIAKKHKLKRLFSNESEREPFKAKA